MFGLLKKEDEKSIARPVAADEEMRPAESEVERESKGSAYSAALIETLTQHKTAAIALELKRQPAVALAALVHALVLSEFGLDLHLYRSDT